VTLIVFTEEPSMKVTIEHVLRILGVDNRAVRIISFDGVGNMEKDLPAQLRAVAKNAAAKVLVLRDNDNGNCTVHKQRLSSMVRQAQLENRSRVRIVCQMLEAWFIGDTEALESSRHLKKPVPKRLRKCNPDVQANPKAELRKLREGYTEITGAKAISPHLKLGRNRSKSFTHTIQAIRDLTQT